MFYILVLFLNLFSSQGFLILLRMTWLEIYIYQLNIYVRRWEVGWITIREWTWMYSSSTYMFLSRACSQNSNSSIYLARVHLCWYAKFCLHSFVIIFHNVDIYIYDLSVLGSYFLAQSRSLSFSRSFSLSLSLSLSFVNWTCQAITTLSNPHVNKLHFWSSIQAAEVTILRWPYNQIRLLEFMLFKLTVLHYSSKLGTNLTIWPW